MTDYKERARKIKEKYGEDFYKNIGQKGGMTVSYFAEIGQEGGLVTKSRHGSKHYERIGRLGGKAKK